MKKTDKAVLDARLYGIEERLMRLEATRPIPAADLFTAASVPAVEVIPKESFNRAEHGSIGCQTLKSCTHTPCLCKNAWGKR